MGLGNWWSEIRGVVDLVLLGIIEMELGRVLSQLNSFSDSAKEYFRYAGIEYLGNNLQECTNNEGTNDYQTYSLKRLMTDSITAASVDHETQEWILDD